MRDSDSSAKDKLLDTVAQRVRALREEQSLSQLELAKAAGLSRQMVVLIEGAASNPSIATLAQIATSLGVTLARLIEPEISTLPEVISPEKFKQLWKGKHGSSGQLVAASATPKSSELWLWHLAPDVSYEATGERAEEIIYVLDGALTVTINDQLLTASKGHGVVLRSQEAYSLTSVGQNVCQFILMYVPA